MTKRERLTRQWFNKLNEPFRSQAIANYDEDFSDVEPQGMIEAMINGFDWDKSKQGDKYWDDLFKEIVK